ncbi:MAG: tetratricopeptide repeat protein [Gemmatimonadales bacterium]
MRRTRWIASSLVFAVAAGILTLALHPHRARANDATPVMSEGQIRDLDIAFYQRRVPRDPTGALDLARLGALYLQRARETGSNEDLLRAEDAARRSLQNRVTRNGAAAQLLATSLMSQHRFTEAYAVARALVATDSADASYRGMLAEIALELGRYQEVPDAFRGVSSVSRSPQMTARLARWLEIQGKNEAAHQLLVDARAEVSRLSRVPAEQMAWFDLRVGDIALRNGRLSEAEQAFQAGLEAHPGDYRLLAALTRLEADRHEWRKAIESGQKAIETVLDPATLGVLGEAYAALGDTVKAHEFFRVMEIAVLKQPGPFHRAWSLFLLDHAQRVPEVLVKAQEEIQTRKDIYGYDLLAWALHQAGRNREAREAMDSALAQGTRDASLFFHAGIIARVLDDSASTRHYLSQALEVNPYFHPSQPAVARAVLDSLGR